MKILVLSFYYQPDLCAGSFRCSSLLDHLKQQPGIEIDLITTLPNRYASFSVDAPAHEVNDNVEVSRIALPYHASGMFDQMKSFLVFYRQALSLTKHKDYDMVYATSSRLFTAFLGARISKAKKIPLYLDIRDIFVDTIKDVLSSKIAWLARPIFTNIERYTFSQASRINLVSEGFKEYFSQRYPNIEYRFYTNGVDDAFLSVSPVEASKERSEGVLTVLYAGNIGEGQGLHTILPRLAERCSGKLEIVVIGDGGRKAKLQSELESVSNVRLLPPMNRQQLIVEYQRADILFLHLNDCPAFRKVLPSKIFEYAALGKPIWAGVAGYAADFLLQEVPNCAVFHPGNDEEAVASLNGLRLRDESRPNFIKKFSRYNIMSEMAEDIVEFVKRRSN